MSSSLSVATKATLKTSSQAKFHLSSSFSESKEKEETTTSVLFPPPSSSSSANINSDIEKVLETLELEFNKILSISGGSSCASLSKGEKIQAFLLFKRMQEFIKDTCDSKVDCSALKAHKLDCDVLKAHLKGTTLKEIPFSGNFDLISSIKEILQSHPAKVKDNLLKSFEDWKKEIVSKQIKRGGASYSLDSSYRPGLLARILRGEKVHLTRAQVLSMQHSQSVGQKWGGKILVFDMIQRCYQDSSFTEVEHIDPWNLIIGRVNLFLEFINESSENVKKVFIRIITTHFNQYFIISGRKTVYATKYLLACLENDCDNLAILTSPDNKKKHAKDFFKWIQEHNKDLAHQIIRTVAIISESDNLEKFYMEQILDRSGFIVKIKRNDSRINEKFWGVGLAKVLHSSLVEGQDLVTKRKMAAHPAKTEFMVNKMWQDLSRLEKDPKADKSKKDKLENIQSNFEGQLRKGVHKTELRNKYARDLNNLFEDDANFHKYPESSQESSDDEITKKALEKSKKETESERVEKETALKGQAEERAEKEKERAEKEAALKREAEERVEKEKERAANIANDAEIKRLKAELEKSKKALAKKRRAEGEPVIE